MIRSSLLLASTRSTLLNGLVGGWTLDGNGNDVLGVSNGVLEGSGGSWNTGKIGQAFYGAGAARVNVGGAAQLKPTNGFTLGGWFWFNGEQAGRLCSDWHQDAAKDRWIFPYAPSGAPLYAHMGVNVGPVGTIGIDILANTWVLLALSCTSGNVATVWRNGVAITSAGVLTMGRTGAGNICLGLQEEIAGGINGRIDDFYMWNRPLTSGEHTEWFNGGSGKSYPF